MAKRGPRPTPTRILHLRGSWRAKKRGGEPEPSPLPPQCPSWLSEDARAAFAVVVGRLTVTKIGTQTDEEAIARYADLLVQYRKAADFVAKHGDSYVLRGRPRREGEEGHVIGFKPYPQAKRQEALAGLLLRLEQEFGLTPSARTQFLEQTPAGAAPLSEYFDAKGVR